MKNLVDVKKIKKTIAKKQATVDRNSRKLKTAPKYIFAGWDSKSGTYPEQKGKSVAEIAEIHEYGLGKQTEKAMVRTTEFIHGEEWTDLYVKLVKKGFQNGKQPNYYKIAERVGKQMKKDLRDYVYAINLVDTQRLANSIIVNYRRRS